MTSAARTTRLAATSLVSLPLAAVLAITTATGAGAATVSAPAVQPAAKTSPIPAFLTRTAVGSTAAVTAGAGTWGRDTITIGGTPMALPATTGAYAKVLAHGTAGVGRFSLSVPAAGVYRVSMLLPGVAHPAGPASVMDGSETLIYNVQNSTAPEVISFSVAATTTKLAISFAAPTVTVSGLEVEAVSSLPADASLVPVRPEYSGVPVSGDLPMATPAPTEWASGAWPGGYSTGSDVTAFGNARHRALDVIATSVPGSSWNDIATNFWGIDTYAHQPARLAIALPMLPYDGTGSFAGVIAGQDDWAFTDFGKALVARGRGNSIVRLGWEFTGNWQPWSAYTNPTQYIAAFRREVAVLRAADPSIVINWNANFGPTQGGLNPFTTLYPGDDVVDEVGLDAYDREWYHVSSDASWASYVNRPDGGLEVWYDFSIAHHKLFSLPEWGIYNDNGNQSDNAFYIGKMHSWFASHAAGLAYEAIFNDADAYCQTQIINTLGGAAINPKAGAYYSELWG